MSITRDQVDSFHQFAVARLDNGEAELTFSDLLVEWDSVTNRDEINAAIREGIADVDAGRTRPADEVTEELRTKYNIPE